MVYQNSLFRTFTSSNVLTHYTLVLQKGKGIVFLYLIVPQAHLLEKI